MTIGKQATQNTGMCQESNAENNSKTTQWNEELLWIRAFEANRNLFHLNIFRDKFYNFNLFHLFKHQC